MCALLLIKKIPERGTKHPQQGSLA